LGKAERSGALLKTPRCKCRCFEKYGDKIAAVIVEPIAGNMGVVLPKKDFLKTIRKLCSKTGSLLIFDEVITGFRLRYGSVQELFGVKADLTCLRKIIGGGFPVGACAGRAAIMDNLSPDGTVYQAGTLSGNPVCVAAGIATLKLLKSQKPYARLDKMTQGLCERIARALEKTGTAHTINRIGSMFTLFFNAGPVTDYLSAAGSDTKLYAKYFTKMLNEGIYLPPSQFEACFVSTEHRQKGFDKTIAAVGKLVF
jgi:glutamate-1-semialdehyde 2,1-aminomutase